MIMNNLVENYACRFDYKKLDNAEGDLIRFVKQTSEGFVFIEAPVQSKYVDFILNNKTKKFKKSDLSLALIEGMPVAWEVENG